jgi:Ala-tRNA(Pro) deacylase
MPVTRLKKFLDVNHIKYVVTQHSPASTAQEIAAAAHISGWDIAKTVIVVVDGALAMVVVPASGHVSLEQLQRLTGGSVITVATEKEFRVAFPDCELGAMPPFGNLYGMPVYVDTSLHGLRLTFNAGTHCELITVDWTDFERLVEPMTGHFMAPLADHNRSEHKTNFAKGGHR